MKLAHTSDAHIDHAFHAPTPGSSKLAWEQNQASLSSVIDSALEMEVDAIIHAGDAFSHGRPSPEALMMFCEAVAPALRYGIPLVLIEGNHERLRHRSGQRTATSVLSEMLVGLGEVHVVDRGSKLVRVSNGLQVGALPWLDSFEMLRDADMLRSDEKTQHDFVARQAINELSRLCDVADTSAPLVLTSHLAVSSARRGSETDLTALFREPVVRAESLAELPASYVALGHIHTPQELASGVWYSGSAQRFTFTDEPDQKGWNLVEISDNNRLVSVDRVDSLARPMHTIDLIDDESADLEDGSLVRVRLRVGQTDVPSWVIDAVEASGSRIVKVERRRLEVQPVRNNDLVTEPMEPVDLLKSWTSHHYPQADLNAVISAADELSKE